MNLLENTDLTGVDISRPIINGLVRCQIASVEPESKDGKDNLNVKLVTAEAATDINNKPVNPGFTHTDRILLTPTGGLTDQMIMEKLARVQCAALKQDKPQGPFAPLERYVGQFVNVRFAPRQDKNDPSITRQDIKSYTAVKD